jgi:hypothetical protein
MIEGIGQRAAQNADTRIFLVPPKPVAAEGLFASGKPVME